MKILNLITYASSLVFLAFLIKAIIKVVKTSRNQTRIKKNSEKVRSEMKQLERQGLKPFKFGRNKEVMIMAPDFKSANADYQRLIRNS